MEAALMYLTGNNSRLAEDLISAFSVLFISFFSAEKEEKVTLKTEIFINSLHLYLGYAIIRKLFNSEIRQINTNRK